MNHSRLEEVLLAYVALWAEPDGTKRESLVAKCLARQAEIIGPGFCFKGHQAISEEVDRFHSQSRGSRAVLASGYVTHSNWARFAIAIVRPDRSVATEGEDIVEFGTDGLIVKVLTFWGELPSVPSSWPPHFSVQGENGA